MGLNEYLRITDTVLNFAVLYIFYRIQQDIKK